MARRLFVVPTFVPDPFADAATFTSAKYMDIQGGAATQMVNILEVYLGGLAAASAPTLTMLARRIVVSTTPTALAGPNSDEQSHPSTTDLGASAAKPHVAASTNPQCHADAKLISLAFNSFGGLVRKTWNPGEGPSLLGVTQPMGQLGISAFTGTSPSAVISGHIEYEPL
jgi:hypothetical protein